MPIVLFVNGSSHQLDVPDDEPLLSVLRNRLDLTGTKYGCGEGQCGACTVLLDGKPIRSCRTPVSSAAGKRITTMKALNKMAVCTRCSNLFSIRKLSNAVIARRE